MQIDSQAILLPFGQGRVRQLDVAICGIKFQTRLHELEKKYDAQFKIVFDAIRELMTPPEPKRKQIGFQAK